MLGSGPKSKAPENARFGGLIVSDHLSADRANRSSYRPQQGRSFFGWQHESIFVQQNGSDLACIAARFTGPIPRVRTNAVMSFANMVILSGRMSEFIPVQPGTAQRQDLPRKRHGLPGAELAKPDAMKQSERRRRGMERRGGDAVPQNSGRGQCYGREHDDKRRVKVGRFSVRRGNEVRLTTARLLWFGDLRLFPGLRALATRVRLRRTRFGLRARRAAPSLRSGHQQGS